MDGGVVKDSASSTMSGEIGMQPYIRRSGTDDSGYVLDTTLVLLFCICSCIFLRVACSLVFGRDRLWAPLVKFRPLARGQCRVYSPQCTGAPS
jgi:hypothetical protein